VTDLTSARPLALPAVSLRRVGHSAVLVIASFGAFLAFLDSTIVNVAFPRMQLAFPHAGVSELSWVLNAYNIIFAAFLIGAGRLADLLGRRRVFRLGVLIFTVASAACALAGSVPVLVAFRAVQAIGAALLVPASLALVVEAFPAARRAHAISLWGASAALAAGLGPPIGGALVQAGGWRMAFVVNLPLGAAAWFIARKLLVESRAPGRRTMPDLVGAAALAWALGLLTLAVTQGGDWGWTSPAVGGCAAAAVGCVAGFVASSRRHPSPVLDPALLRLPAFAWANALTVAAGIGFYAYLLTHILWLTQIWHWSVLEAGLALAPGALVAAAVASIAGRVAERHGVRVLVVPGAAVWTAAYLWYAVRVGVTPDFLGQWLPGQVLSGIGVGATLPMLGSAALEAVPGARYATASAVVSSARQLGGVLGIALLVVIIGHPTAATIVPTLRHGWLMSAACFAVVAVGATRLRPRTAAVEHEQQSVATPAAVAPAVTAAPGLLPKPAPAVVRLPATTAELLRSVPMFAGMSARTLDALARGARVLPVHAGEWVFAQGDRADSFYIVRSGAFEVVRDGVVIGSLGRGAVFGELGLLTKSARAAGIRARRDGELLRVSSRRFDETLGGTPAAMRQLASTLARQVQSASTPAYVARPRTVAVVGVDGLAPIGVVAEAVHRALGESCHVTRMSDGDGALLEAAEATHDVVLLVVDAAPSRWRDFALRQADRVLLVAAASARPDSAPDVTAERDVWLLGSADRATRLAWHDLGVRSCTTVALSLDDIATAAHSYAARLAQRSVGLVLGGGGARALAHLGVMDELLAAGVRIDRIAGCSMGAFIAALFACGLSVDEIEDRIYAEFVRRNPVGDYTFPRVALTRGRRGHAMVQRVFGDMLIEELPLDFYAVATDLLRHEVVVMRRGRLGAAVGASMALPGVSPPPVLDGRLLVDGGILDNLPVTPMLDRDEGPVIGVNVVSGSSRPPDAEPRTPGIHETLMRALTISSAAAAKRSQDRLSLLINPTYGGVGLLEFHQYARMRESGRAAAREALDAAGGAAGLVARVGVS
jgi:NTE family protein